MVRGWQRGDGAGHRFGRVPAAAAAAAEGEAGKPRAGCKRAPVLGPLRWQSSRGGGRAGSAKARRSEGCASSWTRTPSPPAPRLPPPKGAWRGCRATPQGCQVVPAGRVYRVVVTSGHVCPPSSGAAPGRVQVCGCAAGGPGGRELWERATRGACALPRSKAVVPVHRTHPSLTIVSRIAGRHSTQTTPSLDIFDS